MSLGVVVKGTEGIVLAADSRVTLIANRGSENFTINFDNATKLLTFGEPNTYVGAVTYGEAVIGSAPNEIRTAYSFIPEFETGLAKGRLSIMDFVKKFSDFFVEQWQNRSSKDYRGPGMTFTIGGFDQKSPYGSVYLLNIPNQPTPKEQSPNNFGVTWGGQSELASRLIMGYGMELLKIVKRKLKLSDQQIKELQTELGQLGLGVPYPILSLQDCIDLAVFLVKTTTEGQRLSIGIRGVGGAIDVAVITRREGVRIIQQKELMGEKSTQIQGG